MNLFKKKPTQYRLKEFYCAEYDSTMYLIEEKLLWFWVRVKSDFYYDVHSTKKHELWGTNILYYNKEDALDIIKLNKELNERKKKETLCNIIFVDEESNEKESK